MPMTKEVDSRFIEVQRKVLAAAGYVDVSEVHPKTGRTIRARFERPKDAPAKWQPSPVKIRVFGGPVLHPGTDPNSQAGGGSGVIQNPDRIVTVPHDVAVQKILQNVAELVTA